jgi:Cytochrome b(C-terminal)/b6/petD
MLGDWHQLWMVAANPDNIPVVGLLLLVPFFTWFGLRQAFENDRLIAKLEKDPELARTHHRKTQPYHPSWQKEVHVWPYLLRVELLAAIIVTVILLVWALTINAPLEEPANAAITMNPAKAPWYFLGLQEMLEYFDPWIAGVAMPTFIILGLMAIPFIDANPLGNGYYTYKQRRFAVWTFLVGFEGMWLVLTLIGTFIRGPGFMWFWPTATWDPDRIEFLATRNLDQMFGIDGKWLAHILPASQQPYAEIWAKGLFGIIPVGLYFVVAAWMFYKIITSTPFSRKIFGRMSLLQIVVMEVLLVFMLSLPLTFFMRHLLRIKYVWETPWFNL